MGVIMESLKFSKIQTSVVFNPNLIGSRSHGNLISFVSYLYEVGSSKVTAWGATPKGNSGTPSLFCVFLENGFESCLEEFSEFVKEINKHSLIESISNM